MNFKLSFSFLFVFTFLACIVASKDNSCSMRASNIGGDVLILDYNSLWYRGNHPGMGGSCKSSICNPAQCCELCQRTQGCNAWVYCNNTSGCGSYCNEYLDNTPGFSWGVTFQNYQPDLVTTDILPIKGLGPYVQHCTNDNKWPSEMCSLKIVKDVSNPEENEIGTSEWVSGVVSPVEDCAESSSVCSACQSSTNPEACLQCAANTNVESEKLQCSECVDSELCSACIDSTSMSNCGMCLSVYQDGDKNKCFECTQGVYDSDILLGCSKCFKYDQYDKIMDAQTDVCVSDCVQNDIVPTSYKWACRTCGTVDSDATDSCLSCLANAKDSSSVSQGCDFCESSRCFECVEKVQSIGGMSGCSNCGAQGPCFDCIEAATNSQEATACGQCGNIADAASGFEGFDSEACYACALSSAIPNDNKKQCQSCGTKSIGQRTPKTPSADVRNELCIECLEDVNADQNVYCTYCAGSNLDPETCKNCLKDVSSSEAASACVFGQ